MARIRTIKPEFWDDETLNACPIPARLTFIGLISQADDEGRLRGAPQRLKSVLFQYDHDLEAATIEEWLSSLEAANLIRRYTFDGQSYIAIRSFQTHQKIDRASKSQLPPPPGTPRNRNTRNAGDSTSPREPSTSTRRALASPRRRKGMEGNGRDLKDSKVEQTATPLPDSATLRIFRAWQESTGKLRAILDDTRRRKIAWALEHYPEADVTAAVQGWRHSPHNRGENDRNRPYNDITLLLRTAEHIERFRDLEQAHTPTGDELERHARMLRALDELDAEEAQRRAEPPTGYLAINHEARQARVASKQAS